MMGSAASRPRSYDSPLRRQRASETREIIIAAGAELLHESPVWNWRDLTLRAVARRSGVSERTVYRHFANERDLRDAVFSRFKEEAGVDLEGLKLDDVGEVTVRILKHVSSFPLEPRSLEDPTLRAACARQKEALLEAVAPVCRSWTATERTLAAAMLDVLWCVPSYERLVADWELDPEEAISGVAWVIELVEEAIRSGRRPRRRKKRS